jgi:hypothetical protein
LWAKHSWGCLLTFIIIIFSFSSLFWATFHEKSLALNFFDNSSLGIPSKCTLPNTNPRVLLLVHQNFARSNTSSSFAASPNAKVLGIVRKSSPLDHHQTGQLEKIALISNAFQHQIYPSTVSNLGIVLSQSSRSFDRSSFAGFERCRPHRPYKAYGIRQFPAQFSFRDAFRVAGNADGEPSILRIRFPAAKSSAHPHPHQLNCPALVLAENLQTINNPFLSSQVLCPSATLSQVKVPGPS